MTLLNLFINSNIILLDFLGFFFFYSFIYLFIFGCAGSSLLRGPFSSCGEWGLVSSCGVQSSHCSGFSCWGAHALGRLGFSSCSSWALGHRLSRWWAQGLVALLLVRSFKIRDCTCDSCMTGGFFTTEISGKPLEFSICKMMSSSKREHLVSPFPVGRLLLLLSFLKIYVFIYLPNCPLTTFLGLSLLLWWVKSLPF